MTTMLVASIGGHLTQMHLLRPRLVDGDVVWVTNESPQSRSLLDGEDVIWAPYVAPRDLRTAARLMPVAWKLAGRRDVETVISTGSAIAVPFLVAAAARRRAAIYIESATRAEGPSLSGKILSAVPGVTLRTQSQGWAGRRWKYVGSVFEGWASGPAPVRPVRSIVVALGTMERYQFRALVERLIAIIPPGVRVLWQVGVTDVSDLPIEARPTVPSAELTAAMRSADAIVAHAGTGIALSAMEVGKAPVLVPRRAARNEHVDDHQLQTARQLERAGLAVVREVDVLSWEDVERAAATCIHPRSDGGPRIDLGHTMSGAGGR